VSAGVTARSTLAAVQGDRVRALQHALYRAAKADPKRRFHALRDKVYREDVLWRAWIAVRRNNGAPGIGKTTLADVEEYGVARLLGELAVELWAGTWRPMPARQVDCSGPSPRINKVAAAVRTLNNSTGVRVNEDCALAVTCPSLSDMSPSEPRRKARSTEMQQKQGVATGVSQPQPAQQEVPEAARPEMQQKQGVATGVSQPQPAQQEVPEAARPEMQQKQGFATEVTA
jgi:hypothetical protein